MAAVYEGPITGFGSVIVNGVRFSESAATVADEDGRSMGRSELRLGMVVKVEGDADDVAGTGTASRLILIPGSKGQISAIDRSTSAGQLTVNGQTVVLQASTVFDGVLGVSALNVGDLVEVHGLVDAAGRLVATRLEKKTQDLDRWELRGIVANLDTTAKTFQLGSLTVRYDAASLSPLGVSLQAGQSVRVASASAPVANVLTASQIRIKDTRSDYQHVTGSIKVKGVLTAAPDAQGRVNLGGMVVDLTAVRAAYATSLVAGAAIEVRGTMNQGVLVASRLELEGEREATIGGRNELYGYIGTFTSLSQFDVNGVTVDASAATVRGAAASALAAGVYVEVKGNMVAGTGGSVLKATKLEIKGVSSASSGSASSGSSSSGSSSGSSSSGSSSASSSDDSYAISVSRERESQDHDEDGELEYYGAVHGWVSVSQFRVNGIVMDASAARFENGVASNLRDGVYVEIDGVYVGTVFKATKVEFKNRRG